MAGARRRPDAGGILLWSSGASRVTYFPGGDDGPELREWAARRRGQAGPPAGHLALRASLSVAALLAAVAVLAIAATGVRDARRTASLAAAPARHATSPVPRPRALHHASRHVPAVARVPKRAAPTHSSKPVASPVEQASTPPAASQPAASTPAPATPPPAPAPARTVTPVPSAPPAAAPAAPPHAAPQPSPSKPDYTSSG